MAEQCNLTVPDRAVAGTSVYEVEKLYLGRKPQIDVFLTGGGYNKRVTISGSEAGTLLGQINRMDFSTISLRRRILQYLVDTGRLVGTVTG